MSSVESDGSPSWSLDASETGESTKCLWVGEMGLRWLKTVSSTFEDLQFGGSLLSISDVRGQVLFFGSLQGPLVLVRG